jgi:asparagine synthase (glutamine-hydrolysing)
MCGIAGVFVPGGVADAEAQAIVAAMTAVLRHRGPDDSGTWVDSAAGIALGHRRLSILDLSPLGHQPMHSPDGRYVITFNGEIYNFRALRSELTARGHRFRGHSDTEVLLAAVSEWTIQPAVERLNGMFAFALWDRADRTLHLVRDRAGEKPLYYGWLGDTLLFGSELKALRAHPSFASDIDRGALALFLRRGYIPAPHTIYRGVYKLPPGTLLSLKAGDGDHAAPVAYWSARDAAARGLNDPFPQSMACAVEECDALLRDAVKLRMEADVPLGAFLSGGIDSSIVVALMQAQSPRPVKTFAIGFEEARYNEAHRAAAVARHLGTDHTELYATPAEALAVIPRLPTLYDEPFADSSQIPTHLVAALTRKHVTVSLSGDAGDELFGGYRRYFRGPALWRAMRATPAVVRRALARALSLRGTTLAAAINRPVRRWTGKRSFTERCRQGEEILALGSAPELYGYMMSFWKQPAAVVLGGVEPPIPAMLHLPAGVAAHERHLWMYLDLITYLPDDILVKVDRASMGVSLESRIPLLDHRVIEFAWRLPLAFKTGEGQGKRMLREVLDRYVPKELVAQRKQGFGIPLAAWLRGPLRNWAEGLLDERRLRTEGFLDPRPVRRKWAEHVAGGTSWDYDLWAVLMFEAWLEETTRAPLTGHSGRLALREESLTI